MTRSGARLRPDERIAELVAAARTLLAEVGYERFLPAEVASRCGVSEATVYRYFPTRRELLVRVAETWFDEILDALEPGVTQHEGTYERLRYVVRYAVDVVRREPTLTRYILNELRPDPAFRSTSIHRLNRRFTAVVRDVLTAAVACGDFRDDVGVELLRDMIFGGIEHQAWAYLRGEGDFSIDRTTDGITTVVFEGWRPTAPADEGVRMRTESYWPAEPGEVRDVTVCETLRHAAATVPDRIALVDCVPDPAARRQWTWAEFLADAERAARALLARFDPGERIAVWAPNSADWVVLQQGAALAGMVLVALNPAYRSRELEFVLRQSGAAGLFCVDDYRGFAMRALVEDLRPGLPDLREVVSFTDWPAFLAGADPDRPLPDVAPNDVLQIQYTSGTTGFPKGAMLHHKGLVNEATFVAERAGMGDGGVYINAMPMYHIGGGAVTSFGAWAKRGTFVVLPGFDPGQILEAFETYRGTHALLVPTMLIAVLDHPDRSRRDLSSVQTILSGAAAVPASLVRRTTEQLGCRFSILFGQTETHGVISQTRVTDAPDDQAATVGQPLPQLEVKIADPVTGDAVPVGEQGEICCRGYQSMVGYYAQPEETAATIDADGWLHMGDIGAMDERGYLTVTGRVKDMIIRGGMNLYPAEIEGALTDHPVIETAAVIGVPDDLWGEQVGAVLKIRAGHGRPPVGELTSFLRDRIAPHKTPVFWAYRDELPLTPSGKIQKFVLREELVKGLLTFDETRGTGGSPVEV